MDTETLDPRDYTLLVVDDVEENRDLLSRRFIKRGFNVLCADSGAAALQVLEDEPVDLIILDVNMPGMSGIEVLQTLRKRNKSSRLPVIMATARTDSSDVVEALELGANDYVTKPINFPVLHARVLAVLRATRAQTRGPGAGDIGPGVEIAGRYVIESKIGEGGFGTVHRAIHRELERTVAIKILHANHMGKDAIRRFRQEGVHACRVQHPNALVILDSGVTDGGLPYLVMEFLEGHSLEDEMSKAAMPYRRCAEVMAAVCEALAAAHELGIVHRDVKPANIFLHSSPQGEVPKVLDFGIAKLIGDEVAKQKLTVEGALVGTPAFMAPERVRNKKYDGKSDVYSVGVILSQMTTGVLPFSSALHEDTAEPIALAMMHTHEQAVRLRLLDPDIPECLEKAVDQVLKKDPAERPTAAELAIELRNMLESIPPGVGRRAMNFPLKTQIMSESSEGDTTVVGAMTTPMRIRKNEGE